MWKLLREQFSAEVLGVEVHELVDLCHVVEKLGKAAKRQFTAMQRVAW